MGPDKCALSGEHKPPAGASGGECVMTRATFRSCSFARHSCNRSFQPSGFRIYCFRNHTIRLRAVLTSRMEQERSVLPSSYTHNSIGPCD
eukprot:5140030-Pyramimonas_sp.AAC.1